MATGSIAHKIAPNKVALSDSRCPLQDGLYLFVGRWIPASIRFRRRSVSLNVKFVDSLVKKRN